MDFFEAAYAFGNTNNCNYSLEPRDFLPWVFGDTSLEDGISLPIILERDFN